MPTGYTLPAQRETRDLFNFLLWDQFPAILDRSIEYFQVLPQVGTYQHVNSDIIPFKEAILTNTGRELTLSGVGSLFDFDRFGLELKRPSPQLYGTGCEGNSLCLQPTCFGFTEGVIENNNVVRNMCWELSMPCLKDHVYSERDFMRKIRQYFGMFFRQGPAVLEAYQRTRLIKEAIKVICTNKTVLVTGPVIGGASGIKLPFYMNPVDSLAFPNLTDLTALGLEIGGANLQAFAHHVAPRLFGGTFGEGMQNVSIYGLGSDFQIAQEQTASVVDNFYNRKLLESIQGGGASRFGDMIGTFREDGLFPTFKEDADHVLRPVAYEILEPSTIAGFVQTSNPEHNLAKYRALLIVPANWRFNLVEPPQDNFSDLGLGGSMNFLMNTPGVASLSSSMFASNTMDKTLTLGMRTMSDGRAVMDMQGLRPRQQRINEAIRTYVQLTYTTNYCNTTPAGQLDNVGRQVNQQGFADGFILNSTMYVASAVRGTPRPVLLIFQLDNPRSAQAIEVCGFVTQTVDDNTQDLQIVDCTPGNQDYAVLTFNRDIGSDFAVNDLAVFRTGARGASFLTKVMVVAGKVMTINSVNAAGTDAATIIPCCTGSPDDYGFRAELLKSTGATAVESEVMKATYDQPSDSIFLEVYKPLKAAAAAADGTLYLENGDIIQFTLTASKPVGVFLQIEADTGETCDFSTLDCSCLVNARVVLD